MKEATFYNEFHKVIVDATGLPFIRDVLYDDYLKIKAHDLHKWFVAREKILALGQASVCCATGCNAAAVTTKRLNFSCEGVKFVKQCAFCEEHAKPQPPPQVKKRPVEDDDDEDVAPVRKPVRAQAKPPVDDDDDDCRIN